MGLGPLHAVTLAAAREKATACRTERFDGRDPLEGRQARKVADKLEASRAMTFRQCAATYIDAHRLGWKNEKHAAPPIRSTRSHAGGGGAGKSPTDISACAMPLFWLKPKEQRRHASERLLSSAAVV
jgi:hypothetical protein